MVARNLACPSQLTTIITTMRTGFAIRGAACVEVTRFESHLGGPGAHRALVRSHDRMQRTRFGEGANPLECKKCFIMLVILRPACFGVSWGTVSDRSTVGLLNFAAQ